jgi:hypothetical protein
MFVLQSCGMLQMLLHRLIDQSIYTHVYMAAANASVCACMRARCASFLQYLYHCNALQSFASTHMRTLLTLMSYQQCITQILQISFKKVPVSAVQPDPAVTTATAAQRLGLPMDTYQLSWLNSATSDSPSAAMSLLMGSKCEYRILLQYIAS